MKALEIEIKKMKKELKEREKKGQFSWNIRLDIIILESFVNGK